MPRLAGQRIDYMVESLKAMRDNRRTSADPLMVETVVGLSDQDLAALAHYAASK
jgi:cytochrome c553